jgi:hypothetical protein
MMRKESGESLAPALEKLARYASLRAGLEASTARQRAEMETALVQARENHQRSVHTMTLALVLGLLAVGVVSRTVIRSILGSLRGAVATSAALSGRSVPAGEGTTMLRATRSPSSLLPCRE